MQQMNAVFWVILNRSKDPTHRWPKDVCDVVTQPYQFSSFNRADPQVTTWPSPQHSADWVAWLNAQIIVANPLGDDPTKGATGYHTIPEGQPLPKWADPTKITVQLGTFKFYKL